MTITIAGEVGEKVADGVQLVHGRGGMNGHLPSWSEPAPIYPAASRDNV